MVVQEIRELSEVVDRVEIPVDGAALAACFRLLDRLNAKVTLAVGAFDRSEAWRDSGAGSMNAWLRNRCRRSNREAGSYTRTARRLAQLPVLATAYRDGSMSSAQVHAVMVNLNNATAPLFAQAEHDLVPTLAPMALPELSTAMQRWAQAAKDSLQQDPADPQPPDRQRRLHLSETLDGRREISGNLDAEGGELAETALRLAETPDVDGEPQRTPAERRADALVDILRFFLDNQQANRGGRHRPHLNVFVDYWDLVSNNGTGHTAKGTVLDAATIRRLACDAGVHRVITHRRSGILDYGTTTRTIPANLYNALVARDRHCRFPGCDAPAQRCEGHHLHHWADGGPTSIGNLALYCTRHHHLLHEPGWSAEMTPDGTLRVTKPDRQVLESPPPGKPPDLFHHPPWPLPAAAR